MTHNKLIALNFLSLFKDYTNTLFQNIKMLRYDNYQNSGTNIIIR